MLPTPLARDLLQTIGPITEISELGGGCISRAARVGSENGRRAFLKWGNPGEFAVGIFSAEAHALGALAAVGAVRVPAVIGLRDESANTFNWLMLEWLQPGAVSKHGWEQLGRGLARLHRHQDTQFGGPRANFIGSLSQSNKRSSDWPAFWRDERIQPQLLLAGQTGGLSANDRKRVDSLLEHIDELAAAGNAEGASLLHGDLWGGNVHGVAEGQPALIDPASYYGHREVDLAMATLFGGFDARFFEAYEEEWPLTDGWPQRRLLYQLYYMLVHVNLFGRSYTSGTLSLIKKLGF